MKNMHLAKQGVVWAFTLLCAAGMAGAQDMAQPTNEPPVAAADAATPPLAEAPLAMDSAMEVPAAAQPAPEPAPVAEPPVELVEVVAERETPAVQSGRDNLISITLDNVPVLDVIRMFTRISGANIVAGTNLVGNVTVSLQNVEWRPALNVILDSVNMALVEKTPGIYTVMSRTDLAAEPVTVDTIYLSFITVQSVVPIVKQMLVSSNASVAGFPSANAVIVQETAPRLTTIRDMITRIDKPRPQVFIEAKFVELNDQAIKDLGINWQVMEGVSFGASGIKRDITDERVRTEKTLNSLAQSDRRSQSDILTRNFDRYGVEQDVGGEGGSGGAVLPQTSLDFTPPSIGSGSGRGTLDSITRGITREQAAEDVYTRTLTDIRSAVLGMDDFALVLSALQQNSGVKVVSNPKIVVASGETASIHVGSERPNISAIPIQQDTAGTLQFVYRLVDYIPVGVRVDVTPTVNTESNITVRIVPELTRAPRSADEVISQTGQRFPVKTISRVVTEFNVENSKTVAIGGLSLTDDQERVNKIPVLGDIPILGKYLFTHKHMEKSQNEIVVFVTVVLAKPDTMFERTGIPSEGQLIHRHLTARDAQAIGVGNGETKPNGKKK